MNTHKWRDNLNKTFFWQVFDRFFTENLQKHIELQPRLKNRNSHISKCCSKMTYNDLQLSSITRRSYMILDWLVGDHKRDIAYEITEVEVALEIASDQTVPDRSDLWSDENALEDHCALEVRSKPPLIRRVPDRSDPWSDKFQTIVQTSSRPLSRLKCVRNSLIREWF